MTAAIYPAAGFAASWDERERLLREIEDAEPSPPPPSCPEEARHRAGLPLNVAGVLCHPAGTCDVSGALLWSGSASIPTGKRAQVAYLGNVANARRPWLVRLVTSRGVCRGDGGTLGEAVDLALEVDDQRRGGGL